MKIWNGINSFDHDFFSSARPKVNGKGTSKMDYGFVLGGDNKF